MRIPVRVPACAHPDWRRWRGVSVRRHRVPRSQRDAITGRPLRRGQSTKHCQEKQPVHSAFVRSDMAGAGQHVRQCNAGMTATQEHPHGGSGDDSTRSLLDAGGADVRVEQQREGQRHLEYGDDQYRWHRTPHLEREAGEREADGLAAKGDEAEDAVDPPL